MVVLTEPINTWITTLNYWCCCIFRLFVLQVPLFTDCSWTRKETRWLCPTFVKKWQWYVCTHTHTHTHRYTNITPLPLFSISLSFFLFAYIGFYIRLFIYHLSPSIHLSLFLSFFHIESYSLTIKAAVLFSELQIRQGNFFRYKCNNELGFETLRKEHFSR